MVDMIKDLSMISPYIEARRGYEGKSAHEARRSDTFPDIPSDPWVYLIQHCPA